MNSLIKKNYSSDELRTMVQLHYQQKSNREIGELLGRTEKAIGQQLYLHHKRHCEPQQVLYLFSIESFECIPGFKSVLLIGKSNSKESSDSDDYVPPTDSPKKAIDRSHEPWTIAEIEKLCALKKRNHSDSAIGSELGRSANAVKLKFTDIKKYALFTIGVFVHFRSDICF